MINHFHISKVIDQKYFSNIFNLQNDKILTINFKSIFLTPQVLS